MLKDIKDNGMQAHAKYGCWLALGRAGMQDDERESAIFHINGKSYMTPEMRADRGLPEWDPLALTSGLSCPSQDGHDNAIPPVCRAICD
jgi:hypothetical protein